MFTTAQKLGYKALFFLIMFNSLLDRQVIAVLLVPIQRDIKASDTEMGLLTGAAFAFLYVLAGIPLARMADQGGRRVLISVCLGTWSIMAMLCGAAQNVAQMALARMGVAVGEAGALPAIHSAIFDIFDPRERAGVIGLVTASMTLGVSGSLFFGGVLNDLVGWRMTFLLVGLPGLLLAAATWFLMREPARKAGAEARPSIKRAMQQLWRFKSYRYLVCIAVVGSFVGYATLGWTPAFLMRVHGMSTTEVGVWMGMGMLLGSTSGAYISGKLLDRLQQRDARWGFWLISISFMLAIPAGLLFVWTSSKTLALVSFGVSKFFISFWVPPVITMGVSMATPRTRALSSAIVALFQNLGGVALGPVMVGLLNDGLYARLGDGAVRVSLAIVFCMLLVGALFTLLGARHFRGDLKIAAATSPV